MTQYLIIAAIVLWAVLYSIWSLMPALPRRALAERVAGWARHFGLGDKQAQGLQARLGQSGQCGACSTCSGCGKPPTQAPRGIPADHGLDTR